MSQIKATTSDTALNQPDGDGMYLQRLRLTNFRSCYQTDVQLQPTLTLLVGENNSGKSNVIEALRLATSPLNLRRTRYFEVEDISRGRAGAEIEIGLEFTSLTPIQRSQYITALDVGTGRALYEVHFRPDASIPRSSQVAYFAGKDLGSDSESEKREQIRHVYLAPLRDAQRELDSANGNRLAYIIEQLTDPDVRDDFLMKAKSSLGNLGKHELLITTTGGIQEHVGALTQPVRTQRVGLDFQAHDLRRLARSLRLKMAEGGIDLADLAESGLGYANLVFIATVLLELRNAKDAELTLFLVEEPEAHLHPQLQAVLLDYLWEYAKKSSLQGDTHGPLGRIQIIATTHSPNLASSVGVENVVVLRTRQQEEVEPAEAADDKPKSVVRHMTCALPLAKLPPSAKDGFRKIDQYLDATRAALLFARRIILVEGIAEAVLLPVLARKCLFANDVTKRRDFHAVTIINVGSVDFEPYIRLLLTKVNGVSVVDRLVVITDRDPDLDGLAKADVVKAANRAERLGKLAAGLNASERLIVAEARYTLEADLLVDDANTAVLKASYLKQHRDSGPKWDAIMAVTNRPEALYRELRSNKKFISKGEFAHDVALAIQSGAQFTAPEYLKTAIISALDQPGESDGTPRAN